MRISVLFVLCLGILGIPVGCSGSSNTDDATPLATEDVSSLLTRAAENLRDFDSLRVIVDLHIARSTRPEIELSADVRYVAPNSLSGVLTIPDGSFNFVTVEDKVYVRGDAEWLELEDARSFVDFEYSGGLFDVSQIVQETTMPRVARSSKSEIEIEAVTSSFGLNST